MYPIKKIAETSLALHTDFFNILEILKNIFMKKLKLISMILAVHPAFVLSNPVVIADGATITEIGNATGNDDNFYIRVIGGTGPCTSASNETLIVFPLTAAGTGGNNKDIFSRAYSAALTAFVSGLQVTVTNYEDSGCQAASKIKLSK